MSVIHCKIFEPSITDPLVIQGGILQFQLCIDLSQICSLTLFRTLQEYKQKLKVIKRPNRYSSPPHMHIYNDSFSDSDNKDNKNEENNKLKEQDINSASVSAPTIYPCIEIVVLHSRRYYLFFLPFLFI